ncbi:Ribonuclease BN, tRNA processing enzyme [Paenibacillus sp. UNCCL117]|uniref:MBL fold metallo-hydrolase n=1 Tax=unclassified Paenibacillus TaxID=185978 RepID=UPI00087EEF78|nr:MULTISPECIES: MBL fold metallo-hydrolase [unclassified Paenibacillus]SDE49262.1 Ribonuclease BN, tRNA processing enzyme [Paenibacillus sp. cl123]SFW66847.1 Ribonuclease BN, tRNA processing enzyme [Paenibacillus sp. UNCCL117]
MKLTVLGRYGTFPAAGGACSGYLLERAGKFVLLDCGNGVMSRLQNYCRLEDLEAVVITHLHDDHAGDLRILKYAIETKRAFGTMDHPLRVFMPREPDELYRGLVYPEAFDMAPIGEDAVLELAGMTFRFAPMRHSIPSFAIAAEADGKRLVYSGDTVPHDGLTAFARDADVLLCEATTAVRGPVPIPHMTAGQTGLTAREARVRRLLLTHLWCEEQAGRCLAEAQAYYPEAEVVEELQTYEI